MAEQQEHKTHIKDKVRIKGSVTHMYQNARVYNEAWVRHRDHDHLGYPLIYVEWDKDHWAYSGEDDGWVPEEHFELVEDSMADSKDDKFENLLSGLSDLVSSFRSQDEDELPEGNEFDGGHDNSLSYDEVLAKGLEEAKDAEAFVILVAIPEEYRDKELLVPHMYMHSKRDDAAIMLDATMADLAAQAHARLVMAVVMRAKADGSAGS